VEPILSGKSNRFFTIIVTGTASLLKVQDFLHTVERRTELIGKMQDMFYNYCGLERNLSRKFKTFFNIVEKWNRTYRGNPRHFLQLLWTGTASLLEAQDFLYNC
jgi:hypothetical protein